MIFSKTVFSTFCIGLAGLISGCTVQNFGESNSFVEIPSQDFPSSNESSFNPPKLLLVGLIPYLGKGTTDSSPAKALWLRSLGSPLTLKDANGVVHKSNQITLSWRKVPLVRPKIINRQVAGPFASFESAERLALRLKKAGLPAVVAHPDAWQVWVPEKAVLPKGNQFVSSMQTITSEIRPVLQGQSGQILLSGPIDIKASKGLQLNSGVYAGPFRLQPDAYGSWTLVEKVSMPSYLAGVVPHEIGSSAPLAALSVQAILARTWALANSHRFLIDGYHLCSDTQCQVYKDPQVATQRIKTAIRSTAGQYLSWNNKPIHAVYHASNGGVMASAPEAWSVDSRPYLRTQLDGPQEWKKTFALPLNKNSVVRSLLAKIEGPYGSNHSRFRWTRIFNADELKLKLNSFKLANKVPSRITVLGRGPSGRVLGLEIVSADNQLRRLLKLDEIRRVLRELPSTLFVVNELKEGVWQFSGGGFGHGVGLSQAGAIDLARRGWDAAKILKHYYPGAKNRTLQDLPKAP